MAPEDKSLFWRYVVGASLAIGAIGLYDLLVLILVLVGVMPSVLAYMLDRLQPRYGFAMVAIFNTAGIIPIVVSYVLKRFNSDLATDDIGVSLFSAQNIIIIWGSAFIGYLIFLVVPRMINQYHLRQSQQEVKKMQERQAELRVEWGDEVAIMENVPTAKLLRKKK
ncbi:MAG: hypothetical protein AAF442_08395 [Pseudomonadota bacterium]